MNERIVVSQATSLKVATLSQSRVLRVTKPHADQPVVLDLGDQSATLDFSAVADEKMTLVQVGTKLVILFDNMATVTAEPFFDSAGRPAAGLDVDLGAGRALNGEQFVQHFPITEDQSVLRSAGEIPPSGAYFRNVAIDALPGIAPPLSLLGQEQLASHLADLDNGASRRVAQVLSPIPTLTIPGPGGPATTVFEAGLGARPGEPAGTHAGQPAFPTTTKAGTIAFSSPDGVQSVSLGGHSLSSTPQTFTDATGRLTASYTFDAATGKGTITYIYTLLDNTNAQTSPSVSFAVVVTDNDGESNSPANLAISVADDIPVARPDTDAVAAAQMTPETGNVLTGAGTRSPGSADIAGADGGLSVVGVAAGNGPGSVNPNTVGVAVAGIFGTLILNADGSYSYSRTAGGGTDIFTYTIKDADGSLAHTTLSIGVGDSSPGNIIIPAPGGADTTVFEAGLLASRGPGEAAGSHSGDAAFPTTTQAGTITFSSPTSFQAPPRE